MNSRGGGEGRYTYTNSRSDHWWGVLDGLLVTGVFSLNHGALTWKQSHKCGLETLPGDRFHPGHETEPRTLANR